MQPKRKLFRCVLLAGGERRTSSNEPPPFSSLLVTIDYRLLIFLAVAVCTWQTVATHTWHWYNPMHWTEFKCRQRAIWIIECDGVECRTMLVEFESDHSTVAESGLARPVINNTARQCVCVSVCVTRFSHNTYQGRRTVSGRSAICPYGLTVFKQMIDWWRKFG